jgi:Xaa-Pro aminopeptidase
VINSADIPLLGFEAQSLTFSTWERLRDALGPAAPTPLDGIVEQLRVRKDSAEVAQIREAIRIAEVAFCDVFGQADPQAEERILAASLEHRIRELGGAGFSFEAIVAVGDRAALPHYRPKKRKLREDGLLLVDWGAVGPDGYCSDLTRCLLIGPHVSEEIRRVHEIVATAQRTAIEAIRPGAELKAVDAAARAVIEEAGYGPRFGHGLGHGIGLNVHEAPRLSPAGDGRLEPGMVVTVEPGIYLPGIGGIRIEDDVLITEEGAEVLSTLPRDFADPETVRGWHPG